MNILKILAKGTNKNALLPDYHNCGCKGIRKNVGKRRGVDQGRTTKEKG